MPVRNTLFAFLLCCFGPSVLMCQQTMIKYLSGTDKDHTVPWDFLCTKGSNSNKWTKIPVPSNWELQGFGQYTYGHEKNKLDEQGFYKYNFSAGSEWVHGKVFIVFEGSMTDTEVKINGVIAGPTHQGGFYRFRYDISGLLRYGRNNLLEVTVSKASANASVNRAERSGDFWTFGGIFRPVYLEVVPGIFIDRVAINAKADGWFSADVYSDHAGAQHTVEVQIQTLKGVNVGRPFSKKSGAQNQTFLKSKIENVLLWNPEHPNLYQAVFSLKDSKQIVHTITQRFGFRTAELRLRDGFYVNDVKVLFKGVCRHSAWPETGRTLSKEISLMDIGLMKQMNMNAVRMSHYPPDQHFLDACDSIGLFVLDELTGWQAAYDTTIGHKLVRELVLRDVNHPCVVMWDNGNEGGWNRALDSDYATHDPQHRLVIHPWEMFNGTNTKHYPDYNLAVNTAIYGKEIFFPTEFMHGLYDGGHGAGLDDFWNLMLANPNAAGGFLWSFNDEGIVRRDKNGAIDTYGNNAPDGILGPYREKEASFFTIKEIWSPVHIDPLAISPAFNGKFKIENRYLYTNLDECSFEWKLVTFPGPDAGSVLPLVKEAGKIKPFSLAPGESRFISLNLPESWAERDALYVTAFNASHQEICTWSWPIKSAIRLNEPFLNVPQHATIDTADQGDTWWIKQDGVTCYFNKTTGYLSGVKNSTSQISLSGGPVVAGSDHKLKYLNHYTNGQQYIVEPVYEGDAYFKVKWIFTPGKPIKLEYQYSQKGENNFMGITFNYPEEKITGMKWLGRGPYRVWKNRMKGMQFGVWQKDYNNTITGESWNYPEFKGYHAELNWVKIASRESSFTVYSGDDNIFLQMLKPAKPSGAANDNTSPAFPEGNIGFMNAIGAIGTKFQAAERMGPQSQKNVMLNYTPYSGSLWFDFR